jgi:ATP-dependent Clp protease ATP-binding subunit ClpA
MTTVRQMFEVVSERARTVLVVARLKAGERGSDFIQVDDLVNGLIIEDQNEDVKALSKAFAKPEADFPPATKHEPFLLSDVAAGLLPKLNEGSSRANSVPPNYRIDPSPEFERAFDEAKRIQEEFQHKKVHPLHLLAGALRETCQSTGLLRDAGITYEKVLKGIQNYKED